MELSETGHRSLRGEAVGLYAHCLMEEEGTEQRHGGVDIRCKFSPTVPLQRRTWPAEAHRPGLAHSRAAH